jgi:hypothetical protein
MSYDEIHKVQPLEQNQDGTNLNSEKGLCGKCEKSISKSAKKLS